jgi:FkbM family methyltransferase
MTIKQSLNGIAWSTSRTVANGRGPVSRALFGLASIYVRAYKNLNYDIAENGELFVLRKLAQSDVRMIFDVGANVGDYSAACLECMPNAHVHAFEIAEPTYKLLADKSSGSARMSIHNLGLSNKSGEIEMFYNAAHDGSSSLLDQASQIHSGQEFKAIPCRVMRGDEFCSENGIDHIDLLKIDVEGAEHLVLEGFDSLFRKGAITCVQFEFGLVNIYSKFLLHDFWTMFNGYEFEVGPIMPDGVDFKSYDPHDEDFQGAPNYFAVHRSRKDLVETLRSTSLRPRKSA